jgi:hypothetical protein
MPGAWISETAPGQTIRAGGRTITPFAHTLGLRMPASNRGAAQWTWMRPVSVLVVDEDGRETILPVVNITRRVTWSLYGICAALALAAGFFQLLNWSKRRK